MHAFLNNIHQPEILYLLSHVLLWYMEIKIQAISKEVLRFYRNSTVQVFQNVQKYCYERIVTKYCHEPIELKNGEPGKLKTKS